MELELKHRSAQEAYGVWGPVVLRVVDGAATEREDIDRLHALVNEVLEGWPSAGILVLSHHGSPNPSLTTIRYAHSLMDERQHRTFVGVALLGLGYWAEAARSTVSSVLRFVDNPLAVDRSCEAVAERLAAAIPGIDAAALARACEQLERHFRDPKGC